jgi:hypothetical protein
MDFPFLVTSSFAEIHRSSRSGPRQAEELHLIAPDVDRLPGDEVRFLLGIEGGARDSDEDEDDAEMHDVAAVARVLTRVRSRSARDSRRPVDPACCALVELLDDGNGDERREGETSRAYAWRMPSATRIPPVRTPRREAR